MRRIGFALLVVLAGCGGSGDVSGRSTATSGRSSGGSGSTGSSGSNTGGSGATVTTGGTGTGSGTTGATTGGTSGTTGDGCSDAAKLVYAVDVDNKFYAFHPGASPSFSLIGTLNCPAIYGTPFSMSVDRNATAWVLYSDGEIFNVSTADASCTATNYQPGQDGFDTFGMGFVSDVSGGTTDSLFIANSGQLGTLDTSTLQVSVVGNLNGQPELTGTGTAQLWGFYPDATNPRVSQLDKTSGQELSSFPLQGLAGQPEDWAFAFWGGDFWIFLKRQSDSSTNVWLVDGMTGALSEPLANTGKRIVGAGVSTCAPITFQ